MGTIITAIMCILIPIVTFFRTLDVPVSAGSRAESGWIGPEVLGFTGVAEGGIGVAADRAVHVLTG